MLQLAKHWIAVLLYQVCINGYNLIQAHVKCVTCTLTITSTYTTATDRYCDHVSYHSNIFIHQNHVDVSFNHNDK